MAASARLTALGQYAPGFAGVVGLPAFKEPALAFGLLCDGQPEIPLESWLRLAPSMGLADVITADTTFDQLAGPHDDFSDSSGDDTPRVISFDNFARYVRRLEAKASPGSVNVGGMMVGKGGTADDILAGSLVAADECVLLAGGIPAYGVFDMSTTPRTSGSLILTTHALYWRPAKLRQLLNGGGSGLRCFELRCAPDTNQPLWRLEPCRVGPFGLAVTDTAMRLISGAREGSCNAQASVMFNFPSLGQHAKHRDEFCAALAEVSAAHSFCHLRLGLESGLLAPPVLHALCGCTARHRAARGLAQDNGDDSVHKVGR